MIKKAEFYRIFCFLFVSSSINLVSAQTSSDISNDYISSLASSIIGEPCENDFGYNKLITSVNFPPEARLGVLKKREEEVLKLLPKISIKNGIYQKDVVWEKISLPEKSAMRMIRSQDGFVETFTCSMAGLSSKK